MNNAIDTGPGDMTRFEDTPLELLEAKLAANVVSQIVVIKSVLPGMLERGDGTIVNVTSAVAVIDPQAPVGEGGWGAMYAMSKGAFHKLAGILAVEVGDRGIRSFNLEPGFVITERMEVNAGNLGLAGRYKGAPPSVPGTVIAWLGTSPDAAELNGTTISAQRFAKGVAPPGLAGRQRQREVACYDRSSHEHRRSGPARRRRSWQTPDVRTHLLTERAPRVVRAPNGADVWMWGDQRGANFGLNAVAGRPPEEYGMNPMSFGEMRDGCYEIDARVRDKNVHGVLGSMCFPSFPGFGGRMRHAGGAAGEESALPVLQAYNDWHVDEWCGTRPGPVHPPRNSAGVGPGRDGRRVGAWRRRDVTRSRSRRTREDGLPRSLHNEWWDPFWAACADEGTMVCFHIGSSSEIPITSVESPVDVTLTLMPVNIVQVAADIIWSDFLRRYPSLKVCLSEGGIGWVPYFLERVDRTYQQQHRWTGQDFGGKLPSDVFREHIVTCFVQDRIGIELRHEVGLDTITWEVDYPPRSTWPLPRSVRRAARRCPGDEARMIGARTMRHFRFDPSPTAPGSGARSGAARRGVRRRYDGRSAGTPQPRPAPGPHLRIAAMSGAAPGDSQVCRDRARLQGSHELALSVR